MKAHYYFYCYERREKKSGKLKLFVLPFEWTSWAECCCNFSGGGTEKRGAFWTRFRDAVSKLFGSSCLLFSSLSVSKVFDDSGTQIFIWYDVPSGSLFIMNFFGSSNAAASYFKAASFGEVYFPWKSFRNCSKPRTARRITRRMQFHIKVLGKRRKLIKCFVMQGNHRQKNFLHTQLLWFRSFSSLVHALHSTTKFQCMQIWSSIKKFSPLFW